MAGRRVRCPECTVILDIPEGFRGTKIRCSVCKAEFRIPGISDEDILDWIGTEEADDTSHGAQALRPGTETAATGPLPLSEAEQAEAFPGFPAGFEGFFLARIDSHGALFEFPAEMLKPASFRAALPRKCLRCGTTHHIAPHMVIFGPLLKDCTTLEAEFIDQSTRLGEQELHQMSNEELLAHLPGPQRLPHPADLPMLYWICDMCNPSKMIRAQNRIDPETHEGSCFLQIQRIWRAEEFLRAVGGEDTDAHDKLLSVIQKHPETPWDHLPGSMQQRMRQWYAPHRGEKFVSYCPDRSHTRTEDGMAGVLVSSRRLIYHTALRHQESEKGEPLELCFSLESGRQLLRIEAPNWEIKNMVVDKAGLRNLRRALTEQGFTAQWH
ncbi:MAG: hypothetical protein JW849_09340 [Phycisphaerae bacterium]|nr:hypothetical protein [Phycisphaerae bacterium]